MRSDLRFSLTTIGALIASAYFAWTGGIALGVTLALLWTVTLGRCVWIWVHD